MEIGTLQFWVGSIRFRQIQHLSLLGRDFPLEEFTRISDIGKLSDGVPYIVIDDSTEPESDSSSSSSDDQDDNSDTDNPPVNKIILRKRPTGKPATFAARFVPHGFERAHSPKWFSSVVPPPAAEPQVASCVNRCCRVCKCVDGIRAKRANISYR